MICFGVIISDASNRPPQLKLPPYIITLYFTVLKRSGKHLSGFRRRGGKISLYNVSNIISSREQIKLLFIAIVNLQIIYSKYKSIKLQPYITHSIFVTVQENLTHLCYSGSVNLF